MGEEYEWVDKTNMVHYLLKTMQNSDAFKEIFELSDNEVKKETDEEKVIRILKGDFEETFGMSFDKFIDIYNNLLENNPDKLI